MTGVNRTAVMDGAKILSSAAKRHHRTPTYREWAHRLLDHIFDMRERSAPDYASDPATVSTEPHDPKTRRELESEHGFAEGKDAAALWSIVQMMALVDHACGWAFDHRTGQAATDRLLEEDIDGDSHAHEMAGAWARQNGILESEDEDTIQIARAVVTDLAALLSCADTLQPDLWARLASALDALEVGEVHPIIGPGRGGSRKWTVWQHKLRACEYIKFLYGYGFQEQKAIADIADAYGETEDNVNSWFKKNGIHRWVPDAEFRLKMAYTAGQYYAGLAPCPDGTDVGGHWYMAWAEPLAAVLCSDGLAAAGKAYWTDCKGKN